MAVQPTPGRSVPLYVLIIFIVLFLACVTGLVVLFLNHEELTSKKASAERKFKKYVGRQNETRLDGYTAIGERQKPRASAVGALLAERDQLAMLLTGSTVDGPEQVREKLNVALGKLPPEAAALKQQAKVNLVDAMVSAAENLQQMSIQLNQTGQQLSAAQKRAGTITTEFAKVQEAFEASTTRIVGQLAALEGEFANLKTAHGQQLEGVENKVGGQLSARLDKSEKVFATEVEELRELVRRNLRSLIRSMKELGPAKLRAKATLTLDKVLQQSDGQVLTTAGDVIYIGLGKGDGVKAGMRFYVFSALDEGSASPGLKAFVEVLSVDRMTSEATVIAGKRGQPVVKGDLIGNMVFDRNLDLTFYVLGDFDLNGDGAIDPNGSQRVTEMIRTSGGDVATQLSPNVNFVVLGALPKEPKAPSDGSSDEAMRDYDKRVQRWRDYGDQKEQIRALAVPVVSPEQFLQSTGYADRPE